MVLYKNTTTIQDVAQRAQVSTATVSRALSAPERVSRTMRDRVDAAILETGYTLNQAARSLRKKSARTILVGLPNISNPFFASILDAIERATSARGYNMLITNRGPGPAPEARLAEYFLSNRADGLILLDGELDISALTAPLGDIARLPVVIACEEIPGVDLTTVANNNQEAAATITRHLVSIGHRRIAHVASPRPNILYDQRRGGYETALKKAGIKIREDYIVEGDFGIESGAAAARKLLALTDPPTAVFCANDGMAVGFISEAAIIGFSCPADISVAGFDDIDVASRITPPLTTMRQPCEAIGRIAAEALLDLLESAEPPSVPVRTILKSELMIRQSTASPKV